MARPAQPRTSFVAESRAMRAVVCAIEELAGCDESVLVGGEIGTGRERAARVLHCAGSRQQAEFIELRLQLTASLPAHERILASATNALHRARGGTLLIRDVSDAPQSCQRKLLQLVSECRRRDRGLDLRVVATCEPELASAADAGVFSRELYDTLAHHVIELPPLRDRVEDIPGLYSRFVRAYAAERGRGRMSVSSRVYDRLTAYPWPGNVAELKSVARRVVVRAARSRIEPGDLDAELPVVAERVPIDDLSFEDMVKSKVAAVLRSMEGYPLRGLYDEVLARIERPLLALIMDRTGGNQVRAAEILGLNRNTLRRKLTERGLLATSRAVSRTKSKSRSKTSRRADNSASRPTR